MTILLRVVQVLSIAYLGLCQWEEAIASSRSLPTKGWRLFWLGLLCLVVATVAAPNPHPVGGLLDGLLSGIVVAAAIVAGVSTILNFATIIRIRRVGRAPGARLQALADLLYSRKTRERIFDQIVLDNREEYFEAMASGRRLKTFIARVRGICAFGSAVMAHGLGGLLKLAYNIYKAAK